MADYGTNYTDQELAKLEKRIKKVYGEAAKDIETKMNSFTAKSKAKEQKYLQLVKDGKMAQAEFDRWKAGQVFQGKQWQAKKEEIATVLHNANTVASSMANSTQLNVFAANANFASYQMEHDAGVNFGFALYDQNTVSRLIEEEPNLLPNYKPKKSKDMTWNSKKITNQVTQGIIQGESLDKISKRLATVTASQNMNSMKTHARTLMTGAQNAGRLNSYKNAQNMGIDVEKEWMATLDSRTRDSHASLDGEIVPIDKPFSNGLMYPGDPNGAPVELYNCRCTMVSEIKKYPSSYNRYDNIDGKPIENMSYEDWAKAKGMEKKKKSIENYKTKEPAEKSILMGIKNGLNFDDFDFETLVKAKDEAGFEGNNWNFFQKYKNGDIDSKTLDEILLNSNKTVQTEMHKTIQGKDISNTWVRRSDEFDFAIDDILNAQGFDGLPQVVTSNEFDKLAKESNFIMQRTYSAPSQEVLNEYRNQLYNGKWYVDCSTGGAAYGEGMYTFSANSATVTEGIKNNIDAFRSQPHTTNNKFNNVETMTLTKDAKIISTDDLLAEFEDEVEKYAKENGIDYFDAEDIFAEKFHNRHDESGYIIDLGAYGSAKGYDAITSYDVTVVLNRTKLVIKGE